MPEGKVLLFPSSRKDRCSTSQHSRKSLKDSPRQAPHCALVQCSVHRDQEFIASLHRAAFPGRQDRPCHPRQPPAPDSTDIRASSSTTRQPGVVAERRRGLLRQAETRRLPISGRVCRVVDSLHRLFGEPNYKPAIWTPMPNASTASSNTGIKSDSIH